MQTFMKTAASAIMLLAVTGTANAAPVQWISGAGANTHYYDLVTSPVNFSTALANAAAATPIAGYNAHLVTITTADEAAFVFGNFGTTLAWAAGSDDVTEGTWQWVAGPEIGQTFWQNGTTIIYAPWNTGTGEPNNTSNEDGLLLHQFGNVNWNDAMQSNNSAYIVEWSVAPVSGAVPEPGTWAMMLTGFGLAGAALRRRRASVKVQYAI